MSQARALLLVVVAWALIYLPALGSLEIQGEEGRRILPAISMLQSGNFIVPKVGSDPYFTKPPLVNWLVAASFTTFGTRNEWTARLPSALCLLAVALAFITIARPALGPNGSLMAALIWLTNFGMIEKGRLIEIEALYASLGGLAFICWLSWWQSGRSRWLTWTVPWIFLGLGWLAKGPLHVFFFYAIVIGILYQRGSLRDLWNPAHAAGIAIMLGIFAAWAIPCLLMMQENNVAHVWTRQFSGRLSGEDFRLSGWIMNIPRGLGYFLPWVVFLVFVIRKHRTPNIEHRTSNEESTTSMFDVRCSAFDVQRELVWGIGTSFLLVSLLPGSLPRYTMPLLAPAAWLVATRLSSRGFTLRLPVTVTAIVCAAVAIYAVFIVPQRQKREKVRSVAAQINAVLPPGEPLYAIDPDYQPALFYVREPLIYLSADEPSPENASYFLVQPAEEPRVASIGRELLRVKDYRGKEVALYRTGESP